MTKADFERLLGYSDACWALLRSVLEENPAAFDAPFETTSQWNTVRLLLAHTLAAEERWITLRLQNLPLPVRYEERAPATLDGLYADREIIRAATRAYLATLTEEQLQADAEVTLPQWNFRGTLTRADALFQVVNHDNYHRGQVVMALQRLGLDPPNFDYVFLRPEA